MEGFDEGGIYFSQNFTGDNNEDGTTSLKAAKKSFKNFLRKFHEGNFNYKYR